MFTSVEGMRKRSIFLTHASDKVSVARRKMAVAILLKEESIRCALPDLSLLTVGDSPSEFYGV